MLYCCVTIDYLSQLERSGVHEVDQLLRELKEGSSSLGAALGSRKNPLVIGLETSGPFAKIQAAETLRRCVASLDRHAPALRGVTVCVHEADSVAEALDIAASARYADVSERSFHFSPGAQSSLANYFPFRGQAWVEPYHSTRLADADAGRLLSRPRLDETIDRALAIAAKKGPRLVHVDTGPGPLNVEGLAIAGGQESERSLTLRSALKRPIAYSPLVEAIAAYGASLGAIGADGAASRGDGQKDEDEPAFEFVLASSFSLGIPESVARGCEAYMGRWLDAFGDGIVVCEEPKGFSAEATAFLASRLAEKRGSERYLTLADGALPDALAGPWAARVPSGVTNLDDRDAAVAEALGACEGETRQRLSARFRAMCGAEGVSMDQTGLLSLLPAEAAIYLYALAASGNELSAAEFTRFVEGMGLSRSGEALILDMLKRSGYAQGSEPAAPVGPIDASALASLAGADQAAAVDALMADFIVGLYRSRRVRPSLGLLERVGERQLDERLLYDCLFEDATRRHGARRPDLGFLSSSSASVFRFWAALTAKDRESSEREAAEAAANIQGPRAESVKSLVKAELAYATGQAADAGKAARAALLASGKEAPPKLEARSQRMMGLSALALGKHAEASDYFTNAQELSEHAGDEYERMLAAYAKALVEFLWGALVRSGKALDCADESATKIYDVEAKAAVEALRGRIEMELGSYEDAAERYAALEAKASDAGLSEAARRASIWRGRALAYARDYEGAVELLDAQSGDLEADAFRGELEILRGRPRDARRWLEAEVAALERPFCPPDSFDWSSLIGEVEGRAMGFNEGGVPLSTFRLALSLFAAGLDERDPECAVKLHALSRSELASKTDPSAGTYSFFCYLLEERLAEPPVDKQTVLSRAFKTLQQRAGRIENRAQRGLYMERNSWNGRLLEAARTHKFI